MDGTEKLVPPALENIEHLAIRLRRNWKLDPDSMIDDLGHLQRRVRETLALVMDVLDQEECPDKVEPTNDS